MHPVATTLAALTLGLVLAGCGGEPEPVDDGSYSSLEAGAPAALESAGVEVVAPTLPPGTDLEAVAAAYDDSDLPTPATGTRADGDGLAFDPADVAGLLGTVGNQAAATAGDERYVVLAFDDTASAVVFASGDPAVFADEDADATATGHLAGTLVGYYAPADGVDETASFVEVLSGLAEVPTEASTDPTS